MIRPKVEFSEGTYKAIWKAIVKRGDTNLNLIWKEQVEKVESPVLHYEIIKEYLNGILYDLDMAVVNTDAMKHNIREAGYHKKNYTFPKA